MNLIAIGGDCWRLERAQWRGEDWIHRLQTRKLRHLVEHAYATVPHYRGRFDAAGLRPDQVRTIADLAALPVTTRAELQAADPTTLISSRFERRALVSAHTSGSTGRPLTVHRDGRAMRLRKGLFLRALRAAGYRIGDPVMLVANLRQAPPPSWLRWRYVPRDDPPEQHWRALNAMRPAIIYGATTPLRQLADFVQSTTRETHRPRAVITTAETLDNATRRHLQTIFRAPVFDVYGAVELGTLAFECAAHSGLHLCDDSAIIELLPIGQGDAHRIVLTNLENRAMPLIRYEIGDLAAPGPDAPCSCGRRLRRIDRVEGRLIDCLRCPDGSIVSPYRLERAIEQIDGVRRFQVVQERPDAVLVRLEGVERSSDAAEAVGRGVQDLVGRGVAVQTRWEPNLEPPPGEKFRLVLSHTGPHRAAR